MTCVPILLHPVLPQQSTVGALSRWGQKRGLRSSWLLPPPPPPPHCALTGGRSPSALFPRAVRERDYTAGTCKEGLGQRWLLAQLSSQEGGSPRSSSTLSGQEVMGNCPTSLKVRFLPCPRKITMTQPCWGCSGHSLA